MKYIGFLIFIAIGFSCFAQNSTLDKTLGYDDTYLWYTGTSSDVITTTDTTWTYTVRKKTDSKIQCYVDMLIDSTGGTANNVTIYLKNKKFPSTEFTTVDSVVWDGSNSTTLGEVISFTPSASTLSFASVTLTSLTDTTGLAGYPADSILTTVPIQVATETSSNQSNMGEYWQISVLGADNTLLASIRRFNIKFVKP